MRRVLLVLCLLLAPSALRAFDPEPRPLRIGVMRFAERGYETARSGDVLLRALVDELQERGFEAIDPGVDEHDLLRGDVPAADFWIELAPGDGGRAEAFGEVHAGSRNAGVSVGLGVTRLAAEVRIYEGDSLAMVASRAVSRNATFAPASIGIGPRNFFGFFGFSLFEGAQKRRLARGVAREAAALLAETVAR